MNIPVFRYETPPTSPKALAQYGRKVLAAVITPEATLRNSGLIGRGGQITPGIRDWQQ